MYRKNKKPVDRLRFIGVTICYGCAVRLYKLPCRTVAVVQQMLGPCAVFVLSNNIIANCIGLSRIGCLGRRVRIGLIKDKLFQHLRITGMVILVDEVNDSFFILLGSAVIFSSRAV